MKRFFGEKIDLSLKMFILCATFMFIASTLMWLAMSFREQAVLLVVLGDICLVAGHVFAFLSLWAISNKRKPKWLREANRKWFESHKKS